MGKEISEAIETERSEVQHEGDYLKHPCSSWEQEGKHFGPPGALYITGTIQTLHTGELDRTFIFSWMHLLSLLILFPCSPQQPQTPSPPCTCGCQPCY